MEGRWMIGEPKSPDRAPEPQKADDDPLAPGKISDVFKPKIKGTYMGKTAEQWRNRSQQALLGNDLVMRMRHREYDLCAKLAEVDGIWEFPALFTLTGALVPEATWVKTRKGKWVWRVGDGREVTWFDPSRASNGAIRRSRDAAKGFAVGIVRARGQVSSIVNGSTVGYYIGRVDRSPIEIVDDGKLGTQYRDR